MRCQSSATPHIALQRRSNDLVLESQGSHRSAAWRQSFDPSHPRLLGVALGVCGIEVWDSCRFVVLIVPILLRASVELRMRRKGLPIM